MAVLLVSPHFLGSEFIANNELPPLLAAAEDKGMRILWVPLSASSYDETPIGAYQAVIDPQRPIDVMTLPEQNAALVRVCKQIKSAISA